MNYEQDGLLVALMVLIGFIFWRMKPNADTIHSMIDMANSRGGIIVILWLTSMAFFVAGLRLSYWGIQIQLQHPGDTLSAQLNAVFNWISGGAFMGAFGAMLATMKGEAVPNTPTQTTQITVQEPKPLEAPKENA
jgi:hypothetical protein